MATAAKITKLQATLDSRNFFVSLVSLILLTFELNNIGTGADPDQIVEAVSAGDFGRILSIFFLNFLNPIMKLISKAATWTWNFLKSTNFWTQVITTVLTAVAMLGVVFPEGAAANLSDAFLGGEIGVILTALIINVVNPIIHFFRNKKAQPDSNKELEKATT